MQNLLLTKHRLSKTNVPPSHTHTHIHTHTHTHTHIIQELKSKDDQYVKYLKKQAEEVDLILERMEEQARTLLRAHRQEMMQIEKSFAAEREALRDRHK